MLNKILLFFAAFLLFTHCDDGKRDLLYGDWNAVSVTESGDSMRLNAAEVGFTFEPDGVYHYRSTLRYAEAGRYRYDAGYLYALDTTNGKGTAERVVAIDLLTTDSLIIRMRQDTLERKMVFLKGGGKAH